MTDQKEPLIYIVIGEESGDQLGARVVLALNALTGGTLRFAGLAGERMQSLGLASLFPLSEIAVMGVVNIIKQYPSLHRHGMNVVADILDKNPDLLLIIDSPEFTHAVAKRVRKQRPDIPIVNYVSPSVWAWRPGRAKKMARYVDHVLALLPFEVQAHKDLSGPVCSYVGHPLIERLDVLRPAKSERAGLDAPVLLVLPGSRRSEVSRLMVEFGQVVALAKDKYPNLRVILPAVSHLRTLIDEGLKSWPVQPEVVEGEEAKFAAFRQAHAALAASGTVTLELGLAAIPMVVAYKVDWLTRQFKWLLKAHSIVLTNLVLGDNTIPEFLDENANARTLADHVLPLLEESTQREKQLEALRLLDDKMRLPQGAPSQEAAANILEHMPKTR
ncbi:lipid-A-disaccharide synthase [Cohaesibacter celericrescens]|uniref:Lipid-A-disaccharide synthase n=1 Tax=Cohaesibacter celericrescens TaxID=2067669 RepID=A0A2N5XTA6_9HYPH|nr:lipid-A-disaccharide synthase [Cohaesibacter celericrescens]PLW77729.1 lipid-A-disaccharide synthase [Cohaesibacter celericrescens]